MKKMSTKRRMGNRSAISHLIIVVLSIAVIVAMVAVLYAVVMWPSTELHVTSSTGATVITNSPTDLKHLKFSVDGTISAGTLDAVKNLTVKGLTVTFVDLHQDGRLNSGDYFRVEGSWGTEPNVVIALLRVDGGATRTIASATLEPFNPFGS